MNKLNSRGFTHTILLVAFVAIFAISGVAYLVASHADSVCSSNSSQTVNGVTTTSSSSSCNSSTCSRTTTINGQTTQSSDCSGIKLPIINRTPVTRVPSTRVPVTRPVITPPVPTPAPTPTPVSPSPTGSINHPTAANCQPNGVRFNVYASVAAGTPAYNYDGTAVTRTVPFGTFIESVYCNDSGTLLYHYDGAGAYSTYHLQDVSTTRP